MKQDELFAQALPAPPLDAAFSDRVRKLAMAHLAPVTDEATASLSRSVSGLLVPALLMSAAVVRTTETVRATQEIFPAPHDTEQD